MSTVADRAGQRFGRLVARDYRFKTLKGAGRRAVYWRCECDCGNEVEVISWSLARGNTQSCGCLAREVIAKIHVKHGLTRKIPEWNVWWAMICRCENPKTNGFKYYGGRGVSVCRRWRRGENGLTAFECFISDMGRRPDGDYQIDRIDNDGNYEPGNCRWATRSDNIKNSRHHWRKENRRALAV